MVHEGPLSWRISKDKSLDLHVLLLEDLLVLLQRQDEKLLLKCHSKTAAGSSDSKQTFSPVLKLNAVLVRSVATDKRAFFVICTSELGPPQIYELVALTSSDKNTWMELLEEAVRNATRRPGGAPALAHPPPPGTQAPAQQSPTPSRVQLDGSEVFHSEPEELPGAGPGPQQRARGTHPVLPEDSEREGSLEEELGALPHPSTSADGEHRGGRTRDPILLPLPGPLFTEGLADSALEDVESLRHLILESLLQGQRPEDDLTPTPSLGSSTCHPADPGSPGHGLLGVEEPEQGDAALRSLEQLPPRARNSGIWESPELDRNPEEEAPSAEATGRYQVVRKGNCFYVSMLAGPPDSSTEPSQPDSLPAWQPWGSRGGRRRPSHSAPSLALRDVGSIFHTIEQLTVKLNRLKDVELAHRELLRSLAGESGGTTPVGSFHTEAAGWTDSSLSPPARETLASDSRDSHQPGPCSEDGSDTALEDGTALTASSPGL